VLDSTLHRFGPFIIVRTLGRGGMGEVFVARTPWRENPLAAVKRLRPDVARVPTFAERFKHEAELAVRLDHANVVGTLDVGSVEGQLYVASDLVLGKDTGVIADRLRERGQGGPAAVAIRLLIDTLSGLAYVHGVRETDGRPLMLVHRDVTPGNVLVGYDGNARLADFGLAKSLLTQSAKLTNHGEILGTPHYLAPEVIRGEGATPASDIYGLGAVMYRFLTGVAPHQGTTAEVLLKVLSEQPRPLSDLRPDLPAWIVAFIHRMLDTELARRPQDAAALLKQLTNEARSSGLLVPRTSVSRWLATLFEVEKADELEERDRIIAIQPDSIPDKPEGTVVLAHPLAGSRLELPASLKDQPDVDSEGTELALSEQEVRAATGDRQKVEVWRRSGHQSFDGFEPSDVTHMAPKPIGSDFEEGADAMPTRAVTAFPGAHPGAASLPDRTPLDTSGSDQHVAKRPPHDTLDPDTHDGPLKPDRRGMESLDNSSDETHLPGFVDDVPKRRVDAVPSALISEDRRDLEDEARRRKKDPPGSAPTKPAAGPRTPKAPAPRAVPSVQPPSAPTAKRSEPSMDPQLAKAYGAGGPKPATSQLSHGQVRASRSSDAGKKALVLMGLLVLAIMMGVGIGVIVASLKRQQPILVETEVRADSPQIATLKLRFLKLKTEVDAKKARGEPVPARAWELVGAAGTALISEDEATAKAAIDELEKLMSKGTTPAVEAAQRMP
jgi:serine/threonine-protein kinase